MRRIVPLVVLLLASTPYVVRGQETPTSDEAPPSDPRPPELIAREAYARGEAHYAAGEYVEAEAAFIEAYRAVSNPVVLIAVAEARARMGRGEAAVEIFERYLLVRPNADDADAVRTRIAELRETPARVRLETEPPGASITIDDDDTGLVTPAELELPPGVHTVRLSLEGYELVEGPLQVSFATRHDVSEIMTLLPPPESDEPAAGELEDDEDPRPTRLSPALITTMSVGAASLVTGTALGFSALSLESRFKREPSHALADRGERLALIADLTLGITLAATATSVVLHLRSRSRAPAVEDDEGEPLAETSTLLVLPMLSRDAAGASLLLSF